MKNNVKFTFAAVIAVALTLSACAKESPDTAVITEASAEVTVSDTSVENTLEVTSQAELTEQRNEDNGDVLGADDPEQEIGLPDSPYDKATRTLFVNFDGEKPFDEGKTDVIDGEELERIDISGCGDNDLSFIGKCKSAGSVSLRDLSGSVKPYLEILSRLAPEYVYISTQSYSDSEADELIAALPNSRIYYAESSMGGFSSEDYFYRETAFVFYSTVFVEPNGDKTMANNGKSLKLSFQNYTAEDKTADTLEIYRSVKDEWVLMPFGDGSEMLTLGITAPAGEITEYTVPDSDFDCSAAETGRYKAVLSAGGERSEMIFFIDARDGKYSFLSEEQQTALDKADEIIRTHFSCSNGITEEYAESHTVDDFRNYLYEGLTRETADSMFEDSRSIFVGSDGKLQPDNGGRGGNILFAGYIITPVYSDENSVILKRTIILNHSDCPDIVGTEATNIKLVKTDDGWRADIIDAYF